MPGTHLFQRFRDVIFRNDFFAGQNVIGEFEDVVKEAFGIIASHVQQADLSFLADGDRLEFANTGELTFVGALVVKARAIHDLHGPIHARYAAREPNVPIAAAPNATQQRKIRNAWR